MNTIKNIHKLTEIVSPEILVKLDKGANLHLRHANIEFKIISIENTCITIRSVQGKHISENYADLPKLISVTKNLFESLIPGYDIKVHGIPYSPSPPDEVNAKWINDKMLKYRIRVKDIQDATGIDKTSISAWINNKKPMSQIVKAMMFLYFKELTSVPGLYGGYINGLFRDPISSSENARAYILKIVDAMPNIIVQQFDATGGSFDLHVITKDKSSCDNLFSELKKDPLIHSSMLELGIKRGNRLIEI